MAAAKNSSKERGINKVLSDLDYMSHDELNKVLQTFFHINPDKGVLPVWDERKLSMSRCPVLIGDAGCGKTTAIRRFCREHDMELRFMPTGAALDEDGLGIPQQLDSSAQDRLEHDIWCARFPNQPPSNSPVYARLQEQYNWLTDGSQAEIKLGTKGGDPSFAVSEARALEIGGRRSMVGSYQIKPPPWAPTQAPRSKSGYGVLFIDEMLTASEMQQNQIALAITNRGYGGMNFHPGWFLIGASNPPTDNYYLSKEPDARLLARLWLIGVKPSIEDTLRHFSDNHILSDKMYGFLLMNQNFVTVIDNRTWEDIGHFEKQHAACGVMSEALFRSCLQNRLGKEITAAYVAYAKFGDDPYHYPIPAMTLLNCEEAAYKEHIKTAQRWVADNRHAFLGATAHDIMRYTGDKTFKLNDSQAKRIIEFVSLQPNADLPATIFDRTNAVQHNAGMLAKYAKDSPVSAKIFEMYKALHKENQGKQ